MEVKNNLYIISKERPNSKTVKLFNSLNINNYYLVIQDDDKYLTDYIENYGEDKILTYNRKKYESKEYNMDNFDLKLTGAYPARNACLDLAKQNNEKRIWMCDDDIYNFSIHNEANKIITIKDENKIKTLLNYYSDIGKNNNIDKIGIGIHENFVTSKYICYMHVNAFFNIFIYSKKFKGRLGEDIITTFLLYHNPKNNYELKLNLLKFRTDKPGTNKGGLHSEYKELGIISRIKYTLLMNPLDKIKLKNNKIITDSYNSLKFIAPKIISSEWKHG